MSGYPVYLRVLDCEQSRRIAADFEKCGEPHPSKETKQNIINDQGVKMRVRNKTIPFRVTEKELEIIDKKAAKAKLSRTDFLIAAALGKEITLIEDLKPILYELRRIGNNVNQLTKLANIGSIETVNLEEFTEMLGQLHVALMQIALSGKENHHTGSKADQI